MMLAFYIALGIVLAPMLLFVLQIIGLLCLAVLEFIGKLFGII